MNLNIVILAAGKGTRMKSDLPKVVHPVGGIPMVQRVVNAGMALGQGHVVLVVGHGAQRVQALFEQQSNVHFALQAEQLGTGHAVSMALNTLQEHGPTLVLYGDVPLIQPESLKPLLQAAQQRQVGLLTLNMQDPTGYGRIVRNEQNQVCGIVEHKDATPEQLAITEINTGILACPTPLLRKWLAGVSNHNAQGEYYLTDIIGMAYRDGVPVIASHPAHHWEVLGVNSRTQQAELERFYQNQQAHKLLEQGVCLADPARIDIRGTLHCKADVFIDAGCVFEGEVHLANGVHIAQNCYLKNVRLGANTRIEPFCHLEQAQVGEGARIGPYARLRPGSELAEHTHVGNFVELKNAKLGPESKANHLSYIGDAQVGARVNIGAGTITCNYDGANKHQTTIEDDAFIGSDTQLVAPIRVGKGATLGAGTTLTKDAPAGALTVSRTKQMSVAGYKRPVKTPK
ncbi:MAG: bifunctional UDP-N-acetylglucosamine diphosphorylase/glucosamine-1-phosphate N-acetyltransferase GlmU [Limnobacter sp.]|nr:bifunctional UDP-N-acetylglucosamine diphosphorylase/glucosamine-1-phosphate N-acetyltransferase GlmU [Limnobacter sp.]